MKREPDALADRMFDLLVIGGGIGGAMTAWDASLRGLSVALIERGDFGHATSSASSKVIHGGIRFLQKLQLNRVREALHERMIFQRIAPHNVHPRPFLIPTFGHALRGKEILASGMALYELLGLDERRFHDPGKRIPFFRMLSRDATLEMEPGLPTAGLTGAVEYYEYHMHNSERMTLSVIEASEREGCRVMNYVECTGLLSEGDTVTGITARDLLSGETLKARARVVANVSGPWAFEVLDSLSGSSSARTRFGMSKGVHIVTRPLTRSRAVALATKHKIESVLTRGGRHFFIIPWRGHSLIGTTNVPHEGRPGELRVTEKDLVDFIEEINQAYPAASLKRSDIDYFFGGLYPLVDKVVQSEVYQGSGKHRIYDHQKKDGLGGLITGIAAKYTTSRIMAVKIVDLAFHKLNQTPPPTMTEIKPLPGGAIASFPEYLRSAVDDMSGVVDEKVAAELVMNHGTRYSDVIELCGENPALGKSLSDVAPTAAAEVLYAVRHEMAVKLDDVVFRRTGLGTIGHPGDAAVSQAAGIMAAELGWNEKRVREEIDQVNAHYTTAGESKEG